MATKTYIKNNKIKSVENLKPNQLIVPNKMTTRGRISKELANNKEITEVKANYQITTIELMKSFALNNIGIGFTNIEDIRDLLEQNKVEVIKEVENKNVQEGFAVLKKELMNNCTYQFLKDIKKFYKV